MAASDRWRRSPTSGSERRAEPFLAYRDAYTLEWPGHVFPTTKYRDIRARLLDAGSVRPGDFFEPPDATDDELRLVHTGEYLARLERMTASPELGYFEIEAPVSRGVLDAFRAMAGGTIAVARAAMAGGFAANLGGGFHHAFADHGEGFCALNDVAIALRALQREKRIASAAVVDLDVHQGNGTARIFQGDRNVFTFSIHQENNYPPKERSDLDIGLDDGAGDEEYLAALASALPGILDRKPDVVAYVAGADPFVGDQLGGLALTREGLRRRDALLFGACADRGVPVFATLAGGYSKEPRDVVEIHVAMVEEGIRRRL
ncbi:MAG TPA: histone deacetylase [Planctomycetota bacterium]|nr:histone deacetylase [Planctomycetota bacterium]